MAQPGRNFSKTYHAPFEPKFHVDYKNLLGGGGGVGGGGGGRGGGGGGGGREKNYGNKY